MQALHLRSFLHALRRLANPVWLPALLLLLRRFRRRLLRPCRAAACRLGAIARQRLPHRCNFCLQAPAHSINLHVLRQRLNQARQTSERRSLWRGGCGC